MFGRNRRWRDRQYRELTLKEQRRNTKAVVWIGIATTLVAVVGIGVNLLTRATPSQSLSPAVSISAVREAECQMPYVFPGDRKHLPPPPPQAASDYDQQWARWGPRNGAADAARTNVLINVASKNRLPITLTMLDVVVTKRAASGGVVVSNPCGGPTIGRYIEFDLDDIPPAVVSSSRDVVYVGETGLNVVPLTFPYIVTDTDTATIVLVGSTASCNCYWHADLAWQSGSAKGVARINLSGKPFHTASPHGLPNYEPGPEGTNWQFADTFP